MQMKDLMWYVVDYKSQRIVSCGCATEREAQNIAVSLSRCSPRDMYQVIAV